MNINDITPKVGEIPSRPALLRKPTDLKTNKLDGMLVEIMARGCVLVVGGISLIGTQGHIVPIVSAFQIKDDKLVGWTISLHHPEKYPVEFKRIDVDSGPFEGLPFPNTQVYFVGEADDRLIHKETPETEIAEVIKFILLFISDEGPPKGIDW